MGEERRPPLVAAAGVTRRYPTRGGNGGPGAAGVTALDGVSFELGLGEIVGLVGRSGAGKSTLARVLIGLEPVDAGEVRYQGTRLDSLDGAARQRFRADVQPVFQDPFNALDPRQPVGAIVAEPLAVHRIAPRGERRALVARLLADVGLPSDAAFLRRRPHELSGGERQRVALARALACEPRALILDEPVSALDASVRGQVLNLLLGMRERRSLAMLVIAHDVALVARLCQRVVVMAAGRIVEQGPAPTLLGSPAQAATRELVAAAEWLAGEPAAD
ncbi:MAG TPA: dipeptide/oligopeptide/nickel ABC transporter ATP-binding protein [Thermoanaerobaculaceae bacterium]|nr:dipeptide/oligopeptide/nickel ABC transporter ATP-binding protein [Thermoanaerobaculaceae bacterium]